VGVACGHARARGATQGSGHSGAFSSGLVEYLRRIQGES